MLKQIIDFKVKFQLIVRNTFKDANLVLYDKLLRAPLRDELHKDR